MIILKCEKPLNRNPELVACTTIITRSSFWCVACECFLQSEMVSDPRQTDLMNQAKTSAAVLPNVPPPVGKEGIKLGRGQMYGDSEEEEDEEEEEEESTWEKERRMAKVSGRYMAHGV